MDALKRAVDFAYLEGFSKIIIVAKSLGGIIASYYLEQYPDNQIELLILGYIPSETKQRAISNNLKLVIQGTNDRFASPIEVKKNVGSLVEVIEILDADHSYRNSKKEPVYQETAIKELMKWVKKTKQICELLQDFSMYNYKQKTRKGITFMEKNTTKYQEAGRYVMTEKKGLK